MTSPAALATTLPVESELFTSWTLALTAFFTSSPALPEFATTSPVAVTRRTPRPVVMSPTRASASLIAMPMTSMPAARFSSRTGAYDAMYWSARALSVHTSEPGWACCVASLKAG